MSQDLKNIQERFAKVTIVAVEPQASIYQQMRRDIAFLLGYVGELERHIAATTPRESA